MPAVTRWTCVAVMALPYANPKIKKLVAQTLMGLTRNPLTLLSAVWADVPERTRRFIIMAYGMHRLTGWTGPNSPPPGFVPDPDPIWRRQPGQTEDAPANAAGAVGWRPRLRRPTTPTT